VSSVVLAFVSSFLPSDAPVLRESFASRRYLSVGVST